MGNRVKFWRYTVHNHNQIVHEWTPWETIDALRIRYAPRAEILGDARVSAFFGTPGMGNSLVVKVHYTLGSRKC